MNLRIATLSLSLFLAACSTGNPPANAPDAPGATDSAEVAASKPDAERLRKHFEQHVQYPASRTDVLAACAQTDEFTDGEKKWTADNLAEGEYETASDVVAALGI